MSITREERARLRELCEAAASALRIYEEEHATSQDGEYCITLWYEADAARDERDRAAGLALPRLLDALDAAEAETARLREALEEAAIPADAEGDDIPENVEAELERIRRRREARGEEP